jgi:hypothetical protein
LHAPESKTLLAALAETTYLKLSLEIAEKLISTSKQSSTTRPVPRNEWAHFCAPADTRFASPDLADS